MNRTDERKTVFEIVFTFPFHDGKTSKEIIDIYLESSGIEELSDYVLLTVQGIHSNLESIDNKIKDTIKSRRFERLENVCLTAMRYAIYEIVYNDDIPDSVAINEAIELTKKYDDSLSAFVHGNLAIIAKTENV